MVSMRFMHDELDWSALQTVLAVSRAGSVTRAAKTVGVHQSTMSRRLQQLEERLGAPLFMRNPFVSTDLGHRVVARAEAVEAEVHALLRDVAEERSAVRGVVRLSTAHELATWVLAPQLQRLRRAHPNLQLELLSRDSQAVLSQREADVALRTGAMGEEGDVVARRLGEVRYGLMRRRGSRGAAWITLDPMLPWATDARWVETHDPGGPWFARASTTAVLVALVSEGAGRGWLPMGMLDLHPGLELMAHPHDPPAPRPVFALAHRDLVRLPRIRAVIEWLTDCYGGISARPEAHASMVPAVHDGEGGFLGEAEEDSAR